MTEHRLAGIGLRLEYYWKKKDVRVIPDEDDLAAADAYSVLYLWNCIASWAVRFTSVNAGWTVNAASPVEVLDDD